MSEFDRIDEASLRAAGGLKWSAFPDCIGAFVAEMDFSLASPVADALQAAVARGATGYPTPALTRELARACAGWQAQRHGWQVDPSRIQAVGDVLGALEIMLAHFLPPATAVVLPTPAYMPFRPLLEMHGHRVLEVPHVLRDGRWRMDLDGISAALADGAGLVLLCNPHNPLGRVFDTAELQALADVVERHGARVFSDEIHAPVVYPGARHVPYASVSDAAARHTVTALSASKGWNLAGLKCAQIVLGNDADLACWRRIALVAGHGLSGLGVIAAVAAWRDGGPWLDGVLDYLDGNRRRVSEWMAAQMPRAGFLAPEGTYLAWIDCRGLALPADATPAAFFRRQARVALTDGSECGAAGAGFVRLNFAMPRPLLDETLARMAAAIADLPAQPPP